MDLQHTDEQRLLRDTLERFLREQYDQHARRQLIATDAGFSPEHWTFLAQMGMTAMPFSEDDGGLGGGPEDLMLIQEMMGRGLVLEPFFAGIVLAGGVLRHLPRGQSRDALLREVAEGTRVVSLAAREGRNDDAAGPATTRLAVDGDSLTLTGRKSLVLHAPAADTLLVTADLDGHPAVCAVDTDADGVTITPYRTVDDVPAGNVAFDTVRIDATRLMSRDAGAALAAADVDAGAAICAELFGCMQAAFEQTLDYVKMREQFGRAIGTFQVIQHRMADMYTHCEQARGMMYLAALSEGDDRARDVAAARVFIGEAALAVAEDAVQLHGGMGVTEELPIGAYYKRILMLTALGGGIDHEVDAFVAASSDRAA